MGTRAARAFAVGALATMVLAESAQSAPQDAPAPIDSAVVLELFTSQGCSSCPAAERILNLLGRDESIKERLIPLAFHVDYWNDLGWFDPFSARGWTERQSAYGSAFGLDSNYTPQLVINGRAQLNGSNGTALVNELNTELARQSPTTLSVTARRNGKAVDVDVSALVKEELIARKLEVMVALFESRLITPIGAGENGGKTLENDYVVRRLTSAFTLEGKPGARKEKTLTLKLDSSWKLEHVGVAAFLQDPGSMRIHGATVLRSLP